MKLVLITYQLDDSKNDYKNLSNHIKSNYNWARPFNKNFLIKTKRPLSVIRNDLKHAIENRGRIFVVDITRKGWSSYDLPNKVSDWLKYDI